METIPLVPVDSLTITTLVDNMTDLLLARPGPGQAASAGVLRYPRVAGALPRGRHGAPTRCAPSTGSRAS